MAVDKILEVGASFDWISPVLMFLDELFNGPFHTFLISYEACPMSAKNIKKELKRYNIRVGIMMIVSKTIMIPVKLGQAHFAQQLMNGWGIPIENPVDKPKQRRRKRKKKKKRMVTMYRCGHCGRQERQYHATCPGCGAPR